MTVEHLIKQIETDVPNRTSRDVRPLWLSDFVERVADLFEPISVTGRVGYDCRFDGECWQVELFLGRMELIGGMLDGTSRHLSFQFDLRKLIDGFCTVTEFHWLAFAAEPQPGERRPASRVVISGTVGDNSLRLTVFELPPATTGPALRQYPDGRYEPV